MKCPYCGSEQSTVVDSRQNGDFRDRRLQCLGCGKRYRTRERALIVQPKHRGKLSPELWRRVHKLEGDLMEALEDVNDVLRELSDQEEELKRWIT